MKDNGPLADLVFACLLGIAIIIGILGGIALIHLSNN